MRRLSAVVVLGCALAACEEDPNNVEPGDVSPLNPAADAGADRPDSSVPVQPGQVGSDAGAPVGSDGGVMQHPGGDAGPLPGSPPSRFFLPTPEPDNTAMPAVEVDAQDNVHTVYPAYAGGDAYYAFCAHGACSARDDVQVVQLETEGTTYNAMLALTRSGQPRVLLSSFSRVYYGECDQGCGARENWRYQMILDHGNDKEVTGEAFTLDQNGQPRFLIHTYRALFGIGQKPAATELASCDGNCTDPASWSYAKIADQEIWEGSTLRYDANNQPHVATHVFSFEEGAGPAVGAYLTCTEGCDQLGSWTGIGFLQTFESSTEAVAMDPDISLALTRAGHPRVAMIGKSADGEKMMGYFECDQDCTKDNWTFAFSFSGDDVHAGVDLALDAQDHPRIAHTIDYDIALSTCDDADCATQGATWNSAHVERGGELPADQIFLEWNCTIGAWFLHDPSLALTSSGEPVVGYQARDISGGYTKPDPMKPGCVAGTDMTWTRLAL